MAFLKDGQFVSHSGRTLPFKINCDALSDEDIETLASIIARKFSFSKVYGIPQGGIRIAKVLEKYLSPNGQTLIVDDVLITGKSMKEAKEKIGGDPIGVVIFARGFYPMWVWPIFVLSKWAD